MATQNINLKSQVLATIGQNLYLNDSSADVYFIFNTIDGYCVRIPTHKLFLTEGSDVFSTMLNGTWKEINEVEIIDVSIDAFKEFLQFFYFDHVQLTVDNIAEVIYLGSKYHVDECLEICSKFLKNLLNETNIIWGYKLALTYELKSLKSFCETIIGLKTKEILATNDFLECDIDTLSQIFKLDYLTCSESELIEAYVRKMQTMSNKDEMIIKNATTKLLNGFRFGTMTIQEFADLNGLFHEHLSRDEFHEIIKIILFDDFKPVLLNGNRQKRLDNYPYDLINENDFISCDRCVYDARHLSQQITTEHKYFINEVETTTFSINETVLLIGFNCANFLSDESKELNGISTTFTICEIADLSEKVILRTGETMLLNESNTTILLDEPILIKASTKCEIELKQTTSEGCWSTAILRSKVFIQPDLFIQFYDNIWDDNNNNDLDDNENRYVFRGLICNLLFNRI